MTQKQFRSGWYFYPLTGVAIIVFDKSELSEQETDLGNSEFIREATEEERVYQLSGIPEMVAEYHRVVAPYHSSGVAS